MSPKAPPVVILRSSLLLWSSLAIAACSEPVSPSPELSGLRPEFEASAATGLPSPADCTGSLPPADDRDGDGFRDNCEQQLAQAMQPLLEFAPSEIDPSREPYWAALYTNDWGVQRFHVAWLLSYHRDWGEGSIDSGHDGDSEFILSDYDWIPSSNVWRFTGAFLSAHWNPDNPPPYYTVDDFSGMDHGRPVVIVSANKHANYPSVSACINWHEIGCAMGVWEEYAAGGYDFSAPNLGQSLARLMDCTTSYYPNQYAGQECFWTGTEFRGWIAPPNQGPAPTPYRRALDFFEYRNGYPPPAPQFTASISGPTLIQTAGTNTWQANASGGDGSYTYQWYVYYSANGNTDPLGSAQAQDLYVDQFGNFRMIVDVTSAGQTVSDTLFVQNEVGGGGGPERPSLAMGRRAELGFASTTRSIPKASSGARGTGSSARREERF